MRGPKAQSVQTACDADDGQADGVSVFPNLPAGDYLTRPTPFPRARSPGRREAPPSLGCWGRRRRVTFQLDPARSAAVAVRGRGGTTGRRATCLTVDEGGSKRSARANPGRDGDDGTVDGDRALRAPPHPRPRPTSSTPATAPHPAGARLRRPRRPHLHRHPRHRHLHLQASRPAASLCGSKPPMAPWSPAPAGSSSSADYPGFIGPPVCDANDGMTDGIATHTGAQRRLLLGKLASTPFPAGPWGWTEDTKSHGSTCLRRHRRHRRSPTSSRPPAPPPSPCKTSQAGPVPGGCLGVWDTATFKVSASQPAVTETTGPSTRPVVTLRAPPHPRPRPPRQLQPRHPTHRALLRRPRRPHLHRHPRHRHLHLQASRPAPSLCGSKPPMAPWSPAPAGSSSSPTTRVHRTTRLRRQRRHDRRHHLPHRRSASTTTGKARLDALPRRALTGWTEDTKSHGSTCLRRHRRHRRSPTSSRPPAPPPSPCKTWRAGPVPGGCLVLDDGDV